MTLALSIPFAFRALCSSMLASARCFALFSLSMNGASLASPVCAEKPESWYDIAVCSRKTAPNIVCEITHASAQKDREYILRRGRQRGLLPPDFVSERAHRVSMIPHCTISYDRTSIIVPFCSFECNTALSGGRLLQDAAFPSVVAMGGHRFDRIDSIKLWSGIYAFVSLPTAVVLRTAPDSTIRNPPRLPGLHFSGPPRYSSLRLSCSGSPTD